VPNGIPMSSTLRHCRISYAMSDFDKNIVGVWLHILPLLSLSSAVIIIFRIGVPCCFHTISSVSANANMRKRKRTGAVLLPCWTPTVCGISTTSFSIFSTAILSLYIVSIAATNFGGAPYCSRMQRSSVWLAVSYALTSSMNPSYDGRSWF
jgi:hypothetical protein